MIPLPRPLSLEASPAPVPEEVRGKLSCVRYLILASLVLVVAQVFLGDSLWAVGNDVILIFAGVLLLRDDACCGSLAQQCETCCSSGLRCILPIVFMSCLNAMLNVFNAVEIATMYTKAYGCLSDHTSRLPVGNGAERHAHGFGVNGTSPETPLRAALREHPGMFCTLLGALGISLALQALLQLAIAFVACGVMKAIRDEFGPEEATFELANNLALGASSFARQGSSNSLSTASALFKVGMPS
eukprot:TRINITY_DN21547_c0_g1_i1.p1 TRINITY_DN21547_c0_g1~~TRINITY_DN21547_c0_g1_i1.p1  ORF type:complete len:243 (-),score=30.42 TRINITY_DN21547_c0_g1_i1:62-790(-)